MNKEAKPPLKVFLCHASGDKPAVRNLYKRLTAEGIDAWLDQEKLLPGQDWREEIPRAVRETDIVVICLSNNSITREGYVQTEIAFALDIAKEKPEGTIFLIPTRLEECKVPERLSRWQWVDLFSDNGYEQLMRSLRLRANKIGASFESLQYVVKEQEEKINRLYTEGSAALWVEDWDKAYHRFATILQERPNHTQAAQKLEVAKRQKHLLSLYTQALNAQQSENLAKAIDILENLLEEDRNYKDAPILLKNAKKAYQLQTLYQEARELFDAEEWQAVVRIFDRIIELSPDFSDSENLLSSANAKITELNQLEALNALYSRGIEEMDLGNWQEAYECFQQIRKTDPEFLQTEQLLARVDAELKREEEKRLREDQIKTLYEQAHLLVKTKMWQEALNKMEEINRIDEQFADTDNIAEEARNQLESEQKEQEIRDQLSTLYADAVRLLREKKYQEALEKWRELSTLNQEYPDPYRVETISRSELGEMAKPHAPEKSTVTLEGKKSKTSIIPSLLIGILIIILGVGLVFLYWLTHYTATPSTSFSTDATADLSTAAPSDKAVKARSDWQNTHILVDAGDTITISYISGNWTVCEGACYYTGPEGLREWGKSESYTRDYPNNIVMNCRHGALIARIDNDTPFCVGIGVTLTAQQSGELHLRINDTQITDDAGSVNMRVQVSTPTP